MSRSFVGLIRPVRPGDAAALRRILQHWLGADAEHALSRVLSDANEIHVAAVEEGEVRGVMGLEFEGIRPPLFGPADKPASLISAYIDASHRGRGIGTALAAHLEALALNRGCTRLIVVSGARSREVGYPFWTSRYGSVAYYDVDAFGPGVERIAWSVSLPILENQRSDAAAD